MEPFEKGLLSLLGCALSLMVLAVFLLVLVACLSMLT